MKYQCTITLKDGEKLHATKTCDESYEEVMKKMSEATGWSDGLLFDSLVVNTDAVAYVYVREAE